MPHEDLTMSLVAVTHLRIRSTRFVLPFGWYTWRSFRQAKHASGNLGVKVRRAEGFAFWTLTVWQDEAAMRAYRITSHQPARDVQASRVV